MGEQLRKSIRTIPPQTHRSVRKRRAQLEILPEPALLEEAQTRIQFQTQTLQQTFRRHKITLKHKLLNCSQVLNGRKCREQSPQVESQLLRSCRQTHTSTS